MKMVFDKIKHLHMIAKTSIIGGWGGGVLEGRGFHKYIMFYYLMLLEETKKDSA